MNNISSSFRDPSGFIFKKNEEVFRAINYNYKNNYDLLMNSGLYEFLTRKNWLISHNEVYDDTQNENIYKIIKPEQIKIISYSYEWSFSQLKDAALLTLKILKNSIKYGMILKDASSYNIQFIEGKPIFIDTLSFDKYNEGEAWIAYNQFCKHFLCPLVLMSKKDVRLVKLLLNYIDGIPIDLTASLLPFSTKLDFKILSHIHLHSNSQKFFENKEKIKKLNMSKFQLEALIYDLETFVKSLKLNGQKTEWGEYYSFTNYTKSSFLEKKQIVDNFISQIMPSSLIDLGSNNGTFSRIASDRGIKTLSCDIDPIAVEKNYILVKKNKEKNILPLIIDLANLTPSIGWNHNERMNFNDRFQCDCVMALALIHHLAISNNVPLEMIAEFFKNLARYLIIEFVPKSDSQVEKLLKTRNDVFENYNKESFENIFTKHFQIKEKIDIKESDRTLYLMERI